MDVDLSRTLSSDAGFPEPSKMPAEEIPSKIYVSGDSISSPAEPSQILLKIRSIIARCDLGIDPITPRNIADKVIDWLVTTFENTTQTIRVAINIGAAVKSFFREFHFVFQVVEFLSPICEVARTLGIALIPLYAFQLGNGIYEFVTDQMELSEFLARTCKSVSQLAYTIVIFLRDLAALGKIPLQVVQHLWPFDVLTIIISACSAISQARGWYHTAKFLKEFEKLPIFQNTPGNYTDKEINEFVEFIKGQDPKHIKRIFQVSQDTLVHKVEIVAKRTKLFDEIFGDQGAGAKNLLDQDIKNSLDTLRGRAKAQLVSHKLETIANSINVVASSIWFVTPLLVPLCPLIAPALPVVYGCSYGLRTVSGGLMISEFINRTISRQKFSNSDLMKERTLLSSKSFII